jgi:membrane-associated protein
VRTFTPVAAGVGHMNYKKYSLYNAIGAIIWGSGLTFAGYLLGYIPPVRDFVVEYIDLILIAAVVITLVPTIYHYVQSMMKARKRKGEVVDHAEAEALVLDEKKFDQKLGD